MWLIREFYWVGRKTEDMGWQINVGMILEITLRMNHGY